MPAWFLVIIMAVVFTAIMALGQGLYWAYAARQESAQQELLRRLGQGGGSSADGEDRAGLFVEAEKDATSAALGAFGERLQKLISSADAKFDVQTLLMRMVVLFGAGVVGGGILIGPIGAGLGVLTGALPYFLLTRAASARSAALTSQLPEALELMARSLQAGLGLSDAFKLVAEEMPLPIAQEFGRVFEEVRFGRDYREAFKGLTDRNPDSFDLKLMVSSVLLQRETGGNLIEILENISNMIRERFLFLAKVQAMTSEAKFTAMILGALPLFVVGMLMVMNPTYLIPLKDDILGNLILGYCFTSYSIGVMVMRDMSNVEV